MDFIQSFTDLMSTTEIPKIFAVWSSISAISAALGRRTWVDQGTFEVYPNLYTVLVAESGRARKSTAVNMAAKVCRMLEPRPNMIADKITPEALIKALEPGITTDGQTKLYERSEGFAFCDEFANLVNRNSYEAGLGAMLTKFWDCLPYKYSTMSRGDQVLERPCLGIFGGVTAVFLRDCLPERAIGDGVTSRIIFVYSEESGRPIPRPTWRDAEKRQFEDCLRHLQRVSMLSGPVRFTDEAGVLYDKLYIDWYNNSTLHSHKELTGYASRRMTHVLKLALILSLVESPNMVLLPDHIERADLLLKTTEEHMPRVMSLITSTDVGDKNSSVLKVIGDKITKAQLTHKMSNKMNARELQEVIDTLINARQITMVVVGSTVFYQRIS